MFNILYLQNYNKFYELQYKVSEKNGEQYQKRPQKMKFICAI